MGRRGPKPLPLTRDNARRKLEGRSRRTETGCMEWQGGRSKAGYGQVGMDSRVFYAHHLSWYVETGHLPVKPEAVLHRCDNPPCWEFTHLILATQAANVADMDAKGRARRDGQAKLTREQVIQIRNIQGLSQGAIARMFGISRRHVAELRQGLYWKEPGAQG